MFFRCCASLVFALVVSACASSPDTLFGEDFETAIEASRGNPNLIVRAELERFAGQSAYRAVDTLRRRWLSSGRTSTISAGAIYARVVIDEARWGELGELRSLTVDSIESMRFLSATNATTKYGTGFMGGVIQVTTIRGS